MAPPNWPIDYPAVAKKAATPTASTSAHQVIAVAIGDEVKCTSLIANGWVHICYPRLQDGSPGRTGWCPAAYLTIGDTRKIGDELAVDFGVPRCNPHSPALLAHIAQARGLLFPTIIGLLESYYEHRDNLPQRPTYFDDLLDTPQKRQELAIRIVNGIKRASQAMYDKLESGVFDVQDIITLCPNGAQGTASTHPGIYFNFPEVPGVWIDMYTGSTTATFGQRFGQHQNVRLAPHPKGVHYRSARSAPLYRSRIICVENRGDMGSEGDELRIFEQVFVDLFQTTCSAVLNVHSVRDTDDDTDQTQANQFSNDEILTRAAKYAIDKDSANIMQGLANQVFQVTKWPGAVKRVAPAGGKRFGVRAGLNWNMPLMEKLHSKTTWTMTETSKYRNYRRTGLSITLMPGGFGQGQGSKQVWLKTHTRHDGSISQTRFLTSGPIPLGTPVHVVVEERIDETPHAASVGLQPTVGAPSDQSDSTRIGMRYEYQDGNGVWQARLIQLAHSHGTLVAGGPPGAVSGYVVGSGLRAYFNHEVRRPTTNTPWVYNYGLAKIKHVKVDHLTQTIVAEAVRGSRNVPTPTMRSRDAIADDLLNLGAEWVAKSTDATYPPIPAGIRMSPVPGLDRTACDWCHFHTHFARLRAPGVGADHAHRCVKVAGENVCVPCKTLGRACGFTRRHVMLANPALMAASFNPLTDPRINATALAVPARVMHTF